MSNRPDLHTDTHDQWDQGGYCNNLVVDRDGTGTTCGYRKATPEQPDMDCPSGEPCTASNACVECRRGD